MKNLRIGQALYNALGKIDPEFAELIRGSNLDPFYEDDNIEPTLRAWQKYLTRGPSIPPAGGNG